MDLSVSEVETRKIPDEVAAYRNRFIAALPEDKRDSMPEEHYWLGIEMGLVFGPDCVF